MIDNLWIKKWHIPNLWYCTIQPNAHRLDRSNSPSNGGERMISFAI